MLNSRTSPSGVDFHIGRLQTYLHNHIVPGYLATDAYHSYDRVYRNKTSDGYAAEAYIGGTQYKDVYYDNATALISFFGLGNPVNTSGVMHEAPVHLVFFANLDLITTLKNSAGGSVSHRADEELVKMIADKLGAAAFGFSINSIERGFEACLREYPGSRAKSLQYGADMQPGFCFRINMTLTYNPKKYC